MPVTRAVPGTQNGRPESIGRPFFSFQRRAGGVAFETYIREALKRRRARGVKGAGEVVVSVGKGDHAGFKG